MYSYLEWQMKRRVIAMRTVRKIGRKNRITKVSVPRVADEEEGDGDKDIEGDRKEEQKHKGECTWSGR